MHSQLPTIEQQESVNTLLNLGTAIDEQGAIALLKKHKWNLEAAGAELFSDNFQPTTAPHMEFLPPSPEATSTALVPFQPEQPNRPPTRTTRSTAHENLSAQATQGALNVQNSNQTIDLTGDDEEEQIRKAMAASLETHSAVAAVDSSVLPVQGPLPRGDTAPLKPMNVHGIGTSQEDQALRRALEASLTTSAGADVYETRDAQQCVRQEGWPVMLRTRQVDRLHLVALLQALSVVPQVIDRFRQWHAPEEQVKEGDRDVSGAVALQSIFAGTDLTQQSELNIDRPLDDIFGKTDLHPNAPGDDIKFLYDLGIAIGCEMAFEVYGPGPTPIPGDGGDQRLFLSRTGSSDEDAKDLHRNTISTLEVIAPSTEPNTLEAALFNYMLKAPIPLYFTYLAPVLGIRVSRHDGPQSQTIPLSFPTRLFMDPFLWKNHALVEERLLEVEKCFEDIEKIEKIENNFTPRDDKDPVKDLKRTIYYLDNVADARDDPTRKTNLQSMSTKLKKVLAEIEDQMSQCAQRTTELREKAGHIMQGPELQHEYYELRAVLVHDGLIGREHSYVYLRDPWSNRWFKSSDVRVEEVPESTVLMDAAGLHLGAGPYYFLYSRGDVEHPLTRESDWPIDCIRALGQANEEFRQKLDAAQAEALRARDATLRSGFSLT